jgi:hypothetical protein
VLAPWLTIKHQLLEAALIGINLFAVARFTKALSPVLTATRVEHHRGAWAKIMQARKAET